MTPNIKNYSYSLILAFLFVHSSSWAIRRYVTPTGAGNFTGSSWANASNDLQATINNSAASDQIYMKAGTYYPNSFPVGCTGCGLASAGNRNNTFSLKSSLRIIGGFSGWESELWQRNIIANKTILSGNLGAPAIYTDNAYHVVTSVNINNFALQDLTIQEGYAYGNSTITIGGQTLYQVWGGGSLNINASGSYYGCLFTNNRAESGGAMLNSYNSNIGVSNCVIMENFAGGAGAIYCHNHSAVSVNNSTIVNNDASAAGGAFYLLDGSFGTSQLALNNSIVWGNTSPLYPGIGLNVGYLTSTNSIVQGGVSPCTNCPNTNGNSNPLFLNLTNPRGNDGLMGTHDDGLNLKMLSPAINVGVGEISYDFLHRNAGGTIDIGAYEFMSPNDCITTHGAMVLKYVGESPIASGQYTSSNRILSEVGIPSGNAVMFWAEKSIELKPGFEASANSFFEAKIIGSCAALTAFSSNPGLK
jgi:hypothetical protein